MPGMDFASDILDRAIVARLPVVIKSVTPDASGRRIVEVEASTELKDLDGDVVLQSALLGSADSFIARGHFDLDHLSELGARMGIPDPSSFIIGRPLEVKSAAGGRTFVKGEISRSMDGEFNPSANRYDEFWASLRRDPPVQWYSSIYGFPTDLDDCTGKSCPGGATRYLIKSIDWRSLAFTRTPKNTGLTSPTRIVTAKAYMGEIAKSYLGEALAAGMDTPPIGTMFPNTMNDVWSRRNCPGCGVSQFPTLHGYRQHFAKCLGYPAGNADIYAHAAMHKHAMASRVPALG